MLKHRGQWISRATLIGILAVFLLTVFVSCSCSKDYYSGKVETVIIGKTPNETNALVYIAQGCGLFAANGLNVVFKDYASGVEATNALLKGEVDLATCAEFVMVGRVLRKENICGITSINKFENAYIIGRIDKGISGIADLKGKRIGIARQTSPEFYLGRFLDLHGVSIKQVTLINVTPAQSVDALVSGSVEAVAVFQPYANTIKQKLADGVVIWRAQSGQLDYFNIISTHTWVASHLEMIGRLLRSLIQAENYVVSHPDEAKAIVQERLHYDHAYINTVWTEHQFSVSLEQGLIAAMEDEARWMINNNLTRERTIPDFTNYIYIDGLKAVKPEAVNIIR
jgi:NitT/TauT family transport system substrate-binding protein